MRIYENVETLVIVSNLKGILCNKCGKPFNPHDENIQPFNTSLGDYGNCKSEICDVCALEFIKSFVIVPNGFMSSPHFTSSFDLDHELHQKLFDAWKISGVWNCDENPWKDYYDNSDDSQEENYEEFYDATEDRKPLHTNPFKLVK